GHTVLADRHHAELAVHIKTDRATHPTQQAHHSPPRQCVHVAGEPAGQRHRPIRALSVAQSRQVAGAAERKARARSPSIKTAYPSAFSQRSPCPGSPEPTADAGQSLTRAVSCLELHHSRPRGPT